MPLTEMVKPRMCRKIENTKQPVDMCVFAAKWLAMTEKEVPLYSEHHSTRSSSYVEAIYQYNIIYNIIQYTVYNMLYAIYYTIYNIIK